MTIRRFVLRCPEELFKLLEQRAEEMHRSANGEIIVAIEKHLGAEPKRQETNEEVKSRLAGLLK